MANSQLTDYIADFLTALETTSIVKAYEGERDIGANGYPCAFIVSEDAPSIELEMQDSLYARELIIVKVVGKTPEQVRYALEELQSLFLPYTSAHAMYAHGVSMVKPVSREFPVVLNTQGTADYSGTITFQLEVRYVYT